MDALTSLLTQHGLTLVFANVLVAQLGLPIPALPLLIVAGALIAEGSLNVAALALVVVVASLLGDTPWYLAGKRYGYSVLRTLCRISIEPDSCVKQTENIFMRFGAPSLLVAKYIPGFSTVAPPLAGTMKLPLSHFIAYSTAGAFLWAALPVAGGALFRKQVEWLLQRLSEMGVGAIAAVLAVIAAYVGFKLTERHLLIRFLRAVRVSVQDLREMLERDPPPLILDVRSPIAREAEPRRIPGAVVVTLDQAEALVSGVPEGRDVVVYCS